MEYSSVLLSFVALMISEQERCELDKIAVLTNGPRGVDCVIV